MSQPTANQGTLLPPQPKFALEGNSSDGEQEPYPSHHSRTTSGTMSFLDSPPITPRSQTFGAAINPFSPPASVVNFSSNDLAHNSQHNFESTPRSGVTSLSASVADLPRMSRMSSYYGSRPGTADFAGSTRSSARLRETFTSPPTRPLTMYSTAPTSVAKIRRDRPKSTMLKARSGLHKPWLESRDPFARIAYFLTYGVVLIGVAAGAIRCYLGWIRVPLLTSNLCLVMNENFDSEDGIFGDNGKFFREVDMSGFGNGEFEMTTASDNNSFVQNGQLYITPTLTSDAIGESAILDGHVFNITGCTFNITRGLTYTTTSPVSTNTTIIGSDADFDAAGYYAACSAVSNITSGQIINPVQSARLSTRRSASIKYGKVEVRAKIPTGDWLWPAIWMLPVDNNYGSWPMSGEFTSTAFRASPWYMSSLLFGSGVHTEHKPRGSNYVRGSLNWGPTIWLNAVAKTYSWWTQRRGSFDQGFHTYAMEWNEEFIRLYVDSRLDVMYETKFKVPFWERGQFPGVVQNGSEAIILNNPWVNGTKAAPFDQSFYLILDVGVGGTNGWFPDGSEKPWLDGSLTAMGDFWKRKAEWYSTWPTDIAARSMVIDSVKMWQQC
ncbi:GH16 beta-1,3-glucan recognition protein [Infundibulicybe gibba]|nr:GH16 beta-1,3-glucan recognition protein [Infundibulicybe gibba]